MKRTALLTLLATILCLSRAQLRLNGISLGKGLTQAEKTAILDEHNRLRAMLARGEVGRQPAAADMTRLEWSDMVAQHAQSWAENCGKEQMGDYQKYGEGQNFASAGDRATLIKDAFQMWFHESYPGYDYGVNPGYFSTYTQLVTAYSNKLGCGASACGRYPYARLVCNYFMGGNVYGVNPYKTGPACSKCPEGFPYCKDSLCTSSRVCSEGDASCRCTVDPVICERNGNYERRNCKCNCNRGWTGLNCDKACEDPPIAQCPGRAREGECKPGPSNPYYQDMIMSCPAACGLCQASCKNRRNDCKDLKDWGNCETTRPFMEIFCPKECGICLQ